MPIAPNALQPLIYLAMVIALIGRFAVRELRERRMRLARLFIAPAIIGAIALGFVVYAAYIADEPLVLTGAVAIALVVGAGVGLAVARFTTLRLGPEPGIVLVRGSYATLAIWIGALALRFFARVAVGTHDLRNTLMANAALVVVIATALAVVRYRVLVEARIARARGIASELTAI